MSRDGHTDGRRASQAPQSVDEALAEALTHARTAAAEALRAMRALLDASCLAIHGEPAALEKSRAHESSGTRLAFAGLATGLETLALRVDAGDLNMPDELIGPLLDALDHEVERWENRARDDVEARSVLRAFLGLREILWELGMRRTTAGTGARKAASDSHSDAHNDAHEATPEPATQAMKNPARARSGRGRPRGRRRARVQRIEVQG
jgi:hypothetical protein